MSMEVIGRLDEGDLLAFRRAMARKKAASMGHCGLSFEEIVDVLVEFDALMRGIAERYELDPSQLSWISSVDGAIVEKF